MAHKIVLADTCMFIDLFRKADKANSALVSLVKQGYIYCISAVTEYEIYTGVTLAQKDFWNSFLQKTEVLPFDSTVAKVAVALNKELKQKGS